MSEQLFHNDEIHCEVFVQIEGKVGSRWLLVNLGTSAYGFGAGKAPTAGYCSSHKTKYRTYGVEQMVIKLQRPQILYNVYYAIEFT